MIVFVVPISERGYCGHSEVFGAPSAGVEIQDILADDVLVPGEAVNTRDSDFGRWTIVSRDGEFVYLFFGPVIESVSGGKTARLVRFMIPSLHDRVNVTRLEVKYRVHCPDGRVLKTMTARGTIYEEL